MGLSKSDCPLSHGVKQGFKTQIFPLKLKQFQFYAIQSYHCDTAHKT